MIIRRFTLWEFLMKKFDANYFIALSEALGSLDGQLNLAKAVDNNLGQGISKCQMPNNLREFFFIAEGLPSIKQDCLDLGLTCSAITVEKLSDKASLPNITFGEATELCNELKGRIKDEIRSKTLFSIEPQNVHYLENNLFGTKVAEAFPNANLDIKEAGQCLAFERWTAAVFHLGRIAEIATVTICKQVGYASPKEGFGEALNYMDAQLEKLRKDKKQANPLFKGNQEFLSKISIQMHAVNDAWRVKVAHMEKEYKEEEAIRIWDTTRIMMQQLAIQWKE